MTILIIEDEIHTANRLKFIIENLYPNQYKIEILTGVKEALNWFKKNKTDPYLIFQDIELSDGNCFEIYDFINIKSPILFTTAFGEYALKAHEINSIGYILKPYDVNDIENAFSKLTDYKNLFKKTSDSKIRTRILIKNGSSYKIVLTSDISYFFTKDGSTYVTTTNTNSTFLMDDSINELENQFKSQEFFRVNRQFLISIQSILEISNWTNSRLILQLKPSVSEDVIVSREKVKEFKNWLGGE